MTIPGWTPHEWFAACGIAVAAVRYTTYFYELIKGRARPHVCSWFNWSLIVGISTIAQYQAGGGPSVWILGSVSFFCMIIAIIAVRYGEKTITRGDWITFSAVLLAIPVWLLTKDPLTTFIVLLFIDVCSYYPTWRKMWPDPWSEPAFGFFLSGLRYFFALLAVPHASFLTLLYPFWLMACDWGGCVYAVWRRRQLNAQRA